MTDFNEFSMPADSIQMQQDARMTPESNVIGARARELFESVRFNITERDMRAEDVAGASTDMDRAERLFDRAVAVHTDMAMYQVHFFTVNEISATIRRSINRSLEQQQ